MLILLASMRKVKSDVNTFSMNISHKGTIPRVRAMTSSAFRSGTVYFGIIIWILSFLISLSFGHCS